MLKASVARALTALLIGAIYAYRYSAAFFFGRQCRFLPTCSEYAIAALRHYGPGRGTWLAVRRIARCHPWGGAGYDPPPR